MKCWLRFRGITQFWHCIVVIGFQSFVLMRAFRNYLRFRSQVFDARHGMDWDPYPLNFYVNCLVISSAFTICMNFFFCADKESPVLGRIKLQTSNFNINQRLSNNLEGSSNKTDSSNLVPTSQALKLKKNGSVRFPVAYLFHVLAAYSILLPVTWMTGEQAKNEAILPNLVWQTDLSFIFPVMSAKESIRTTRLRHPELAQLATDVLKKRIPGSGYLSGSALLAIQPPSLGGLGQLPQTVEQEQVVADLRSEVLQHIQRSQSGVRAEFVNSDEKIRPISPEIINLFFAVTFLAIRLASSFWSAWPTFSYLSSILLIGTGVYITFEFAAVSLLIQLTVCLSSTGSSSLNPNPFNRSFEDTRGYINLIMIRLPIRLSTWQMILTIAAGFVVNLGSFIVLFYLGLRQFYKALHANIYTIANMLSMADQNSSCTGGNHSPDIEMQPLQAGFEEHEIIQQPTNSLLVDKSLPKSSFNPIQSNSNFRKRSKCALCASRRCMSKQKEDRHLIALGFLTLIFSIAIRMPCLLDIFLVYWNEREYLCFTVVIMFVVVHMAWLLMWFGFVVKQKWNFPLRCTPSSTMQQSTTSNGCNVSDVGKSIQHPQLVEDGYDLSIGSPPPQSLGTDAGFSNSNYVYFSPVQIPTGFQANLLSPNDASLVNLCQTSPTEYQRVKRSPQRENVATFNERYGYNEKVNPLVNEMTPCSLAQSTQLKIGPCLLRPTPTKYQPLVRRKVSSSWAPENQLLFPYNRNKVENVIMGEVIVNEANTNQCGSIHFSSNKPHMQAHRGEIQTLPKRKFRQANSPRISPLASNMANFGRTLQPELRTPPSKSLVDGKMPAYLLISNKTQLHRFPTPPQDPFASDTSTADDQLCSQV